MELSPLSAARVDALLADPQAERLHLGPRGEVWRVPWDERSDATLKIDRPPTLRARLSTRLRGSRAQRSCAAARALRQLGFPVAEPLGVLEEPGRSVYAARFVTGPRLDEVLGSRPELATSAAKFAARLHAAGVRCRDLKPPNLIVADEGLVLVDLVDVRPGAPVSRRWRLRNLAALDAYGQLDAQPLGVRPRLGAVKAYATLAALDWRALLRDLLPYSRAKRRKLVDKLGPRA